MMLTDNARAAIEKALDAAGGKAPNSMPTAGTPRPWRLPDREHKKK